MTKHPQTSIHDTGFAAHESVRQENIKLNERIKELEADKQDLALIAKEQENAHVAANMRNVELQVQLKALPCYVQWFWHDDDDPCGYCPLCKTQGAGE